MYGIDIPTKTELVAHNRTAEQVMKLCLISCERCYHHPRNQKRASFLLLLRRR